MAKSVDFFDQQVKNIRLGQISPALISAIKFNGDTIGAIAVVNYGNKSVVITPYNIHHVSMINVILSKAGFNCYVSSKTQIVVSFHLPNLEERGRIIKQLDQMAEQARVAIRNIRRKYRDNDNIEDITARHISSINEILQSKKGSL